MYDEIFYRNNIDIIISEDGKNQSIAEVAFIKIDKTFTTSLN